MVALFIAALGALVFYALFSGEIKTCFFCKIFKSSSTYHQPFSYFIYLKTINLTHLPVPHNCSAQKQEVHHIAPLSIQERHELALLLNR